MRKPAIHIYRDFSKMYAFCAFLDLFACFAVFMFFILGAMGIMTGGE